MSIVLYNPKTMQGSVWNEKDAPAMIAKGWLTQSQAKVIMDEDATEKRRIWLASEETKPERFAMLRQARDAKLAEYDTKVAQLSRKAREGADMEARLASWDAYATALCELPEQEGAPWDGGGEMTPWPEAPTVANAQEEV